MTEWTDESSTHYLNVDLELRADFDLQPLVSALGPEMFVLYEEFDDRRAFASLEFNGDTTDPEDGVSRFAALVASLDSRARGLWDRCVSKTMNIGVQSGMRPHATAYPLSVDAVMSLATIGASIEITVYGARQRVVPDEDPRSSKQGV